ncbi:unnamed protein product [Cuscuta campestris]|uniref:Uncharacterized protein n=1 Tax=Cuscuta campestris TaxID=132261 RepID=A0A484NIW4_9ASTE|nr:unnamed protein product [Cuscuta campestris]
MTLSKWSPDFHADHENPVFPVWVSLIHLPIHLHEAKALHCLARALGNPLMMDASATAKTRPSIARFCVEIDISKELTKKILIENGGMGFFQEITYENLPEFCRQCRKSGHSTRNCCGKEKRQEEDSNNKVQRDAILKTPTCDFGRANRNLALVKKLLRTKLEAYGAVQTTKEDKTPANTTEEAAKDDGLQGPYPPPDLGPIFDIKQPPTCGLVPNSGTNRTDQNIMCQDLGHKNSEVDIVVSSPSPKGDELAT